MSDFDKEAEREKLREKYERDKEKRAATEQMSELLLKGATMTNAHCGTCGDPIFRYDGQEFCPTCEEVLTEGDADAQQASDSDTTGSDATETPQADADTPATDATGTVDGTAEQEVHADSLAPDPADADTSAPEAGGSAGGSADATAPTTDPRAATDVQSAGSDLPSDETSSRMSPAPETVDSAGASLANARVSLTRTVTKLAREAEESDDLERTRACLAATEEAADALAAVKRADR